MTATGGHVSSVARSCPLHGEAFGVPILVADLDDIIESKEALTRQSDLVALQELHRLQAHQAR